MPDINLSRARWFAIVAFIAAWFCVDGIFTPPDFGQLDIYYFKDSGINFAEGRGLTTRFTYGNPTFSYRDYAQYPPVYPLLFGLFAKAGGVSARSNQVFNSMIAMLTGLAGFFVLRPAIARAVGERAREWLEPVVAAASIATGYFYLSYDRPDALAVTLGIATLLPAIRGTSHGSAMAAGALCALTAFTSPFAGLWTTVAASIGILATRGRNFRGSLGRLVWVGTGGSGAAIGLLATIRAALPGWFDGFLGVATGSNTHNETGGGYFLALLQGDVRTWWSGFGYSGPESYILLVKLGAVAAALLGRILLTRARPQASRQAPRMLPLLLMMSSICLITAPYQSNYAAITAALLLTAWASIETAAPLGIQREAAIAILVAFGANVILTVPFQARDLFVRFSARESLPRAMAYLESHRKELETPDGYSAASPANYILWRQAGLHPLIDVYSGFRLRENREKLLVLALSFPGSGDLLQPQRVEFIPGDEYLQVFEPVLPQPVSIGGHLLSSSSQTWESAVYRRRTCEGCSASR